MERDAVGKIRSDSVKALVIVSFGKRRIAPMGFEDEQDRT